ncbi:MAG: Hsp20/alpha crystallin family protein [Lachnospiraceae bacterium]|nr:Hsp20/alpha crystallin family protein [Lachnospiraceae bacterium]
MTVMTNSFVNDFLDDFFGNGGFMENCGKLLGNGNGVGFDMNFAGGRMLTDVTETETSYLFNIDLPGYELANIKGEVKDGYLTITATNEEDKKDESDKKNGYIRRERIYGTCSRTYFVGKDVTQADIKAKFKNGVLTVEVPKKEKKELPEDRFIMIEG